MGQISCHDFLAVHLWFKRVVALKIVCGALAHHPQLFFCLLFHTPSARTLVFPNFSSSAFVCSNSFLCSVITVRDWRVIAYSSTFSTLALQIILPVFLTLFLTGMHHLITAWWDRPCSNNNLETTTAPIIQTWIWNLEKLNALSKVIHLVINTIFKYWQHGFRTRTWLNHYNVH